MKLSQLPVLNNWYVALYNPMITSVLDSKISLYGKVSNSNKFADNSDIKTSYIKEIAEVEGERVVVTHSGSHYRLGVTSLFIEKEFPGIRKQILNLTGKRSD